MAGLLVIGMGMGAEKLGRKISEKRLERKEKKALEQREAVYGHAESSSAGAVQNPRDVRPDRQSRKSEEARREQDGGKRRRSMSSERTLLPDDPPPRYEEATRQDQRRI
ncbi:hypothetical protein FB567DRAFT_599715 [Paraphoma chrysanthemicola]|uniref:Uncharacterized protein n=1 Tax=Paraphoma chrysanthemicola TaxID=798071 RepID=A0A8K0QSS1_9PLEO|nr:hypothetical protein FB567DRAFT_599715 [Paraphoma chrysanthemicola]